MKPKETFKILDSIVGPPLAELRFAGCKDSNGKYLIWSRPFSRPKYETVSIQIDKWEWDPWAGAQFRINFGRTSTKGSVVLSRHTATMHDLLNSVELRQVQELQNTVIAKRRLPTRQEYKHHHGQDFTFGLYHLADKESLSKPVKYSIKRFTDIWLLFIDQADVLSWGNFLASWLPMAIARNQAEDWSKFGW